MKPAVAQAEAARPRITRPALVAPLTIDSEKRPSVWIFPSEKAAEFFIESETLLSVLSQIITTDKLKELSAHVDARGVISQAELEKLGIRLLFDSKMLVLSLEIPLPLRKSEDINYTRPRPSSGRLYESAPFSGYLNFRGALSISNTRDLNTERFDPLQGTIESVTQWHRFVLQTGIDYDGQSVQPYHRSDSRLTYDWPDQALRLSVGDLENQLTGFQNALQMGGVSFSRNFAQQPYRNIHPVSRTEIAIERPSDIEVVINGTTFSHFRAAPGPVRLSQLPLSTGLNTVILRVTDDLGRIEIINLTYLFDLGLLAEGVSEFSYEIGVASEDVTTGHWRDRNYNFHQHRTSVFHRYGVSREFTFGLNFQNDANDLLTGLEARWLSAVGLISNDTALMKEAGREQQDIGTRWSYHSFDQYSGHRAPFRVNSNLEYQGAHFIPVGSGEIENPYSWRADFQIQKALREDLIASLTEQYQWAREGADNRSLSLDLSWSPRPYLQLGSTLSFDTTDRPSQALFLTLTYYDLANLNSVIGRFNSPMQALRLEAQRQPGYGVNEWQLDAGLERQRDYREIDARANFRGYRGDIGLSHRSYQVPSEESRSLNSTAVNFGTAVAWTDQAIAISRPIQDSFVILPNHSAELEGLEIGVNKLGDRPQAWTGAFGPGVISTVTSYTDQPVVFDTQNFPMGVRPESEFNTAHPSYKSGVTIPIKTSGLIAVSGILVDQSGKLMGLVSGEILNSEKKVMGEFFTNRRGGFVIESLEPGEYILRLYDAAKTGAHLSIPATTKNSKVRTGLIRLTAPLSVGELP